MADKDKLRGLQEDTDKQYEKMIKEKLKEELKQQKQNMAPEGVNVSKTNNSMWQALSWGEKK